MREVLSEYRGALRDGQGRYDIWLIEVPIALAVAGVGMVYAGLMVTVLSTLKLLPAMVSGYVRLCSSYSRLNTGLMMLSFPLFATALVVWPALCIGGYAFVCVGGLLYGSWAFKVYFSDGLLYSLWLVHDGVREFDGFSNEAIFNSRTDECTCICKLPEPRRSARDSWETVQRQPSVLLEPSARRRSLLPNRNGSALDLETSSIGHNDNTRESILSAHSAERSAPLLSRSTSETILNINAVWDSFFAACTIHSVDALREHLITRDEILDMESFLFIGIPSLTMFRGFVVSCCLSVVDSCCVRCTAVDSCRDQSKRALTASCWLQASR